MNSLIDDGYKILSLEQKDPPEDMEGNDWYCYVNGLGDTTMRGYQQGSRKAVTESVSEIVVRLNERRFGKRGRVHLDTSAKGKKTQAK